MSATIATLLATARAQLAPVSPSAALDARILLAEALGVSDSYLFTWSDRSVDAAGQARFHAWLARRVAGEPVAYILGAREFYGRRFAVSPATLIPRPDTELLVELTLQQAGSTALRVLDLGTGTGAVAITLALERPQWQLVAVDRVPEALALAAANGTALGARVDWRCSDWFAAVPECFDVIVSNPPYICADDPHLVQGDVRFEPASALVAGDDGLDDVRRIVAEAGVHLRAGGLLLLEHGYDQGAAVRSCLRQAGFDAVTTARDYGDQERVTWGRWTQC